jgi:hypothetical protein
MVYMGLSNKKRISLITHTQFFTPISTYRQPTLIEKPYIVNVIVK